ncbi:MAG TPA: hypothetical protein VKJ01_03110 [Candidatus Solibacter sp.]|nr:hypothetical protein [Candidatus Solibacter sp.]
MSVKYLPVLAVALLVAGCNRQHSQAATQAAGRDPEAVQRAAPTLPHVSARIAGEPQPGETRAKAEHPVEAEIPARTRICVRLGDSLDSQINRAGERFSAYLDEPVVSGNRVVIPKGTLFRGHIIEATSSGRFRGRALLGVTLDSFRLRGITYLIATGADARTSDSHKQRNAVAIGGGSGAGAAMGALDGGGTGVLIGGGAGAAAGTTGAFLTGKKNVKLPVETPLVFSLRNAVTVRG